MKKASCIVAVLAVGIAACASMFMKGGDLVDERYQPKKILVTYSAEGNVPAGVQYFLIETDKGPAIFERSQNGSGALFLTRWQDKDGDHYAGWVATSHGYEYVIAKRTGIVKKYVYPKGYYSVKEVDGQERPVPDVPIDPVAKLIPKK